MVSTESLNESSIATRISPSIGILAGPTATGKSSLAIELACEVGNIEIINADSLLVYKEMNIGTAKPSAEELNRIPHHLINIKTPDEPFTAGEFKRAAEAALQDIHSRGKRALLVGGTGFYLKSLLFGMWGESEQNASVSLELKTQLEGQCQTKLYQKLFQKDPTSALRIGISDRYRLVRALVLMDQTGKSLTQLQAEVPSLPDPRFALWILDRTSDELHLRIERRTQHMLEEGLISEFQILHSKYPLSRALHAIGYAQVGDSVAGNLPQGRKIEPGMNGLQSEISLATRQLVKRQRTWFRNQSKKTPGSRWFHLEQDRAMLEVEFKSLYRNAYVQI